MSAPSAPRSAPILGQEHAIRTIVRALERGRVPHAWIFHGPFGTGKFTTAFRFARLLLDPSATAEDRRRFEPPHDSETARLIDAGTHPDLHVIRKELAAASAQRELRERKQTNIPLDLLRERMIGGGDVGSANAPPVFRTPMLGHGKVFIIDEAELLEVEAQNAMLKTLEEPPERTWIILCAQQEERLLPTIRSRCQRLPFGPLALPAMARWWEMTGLSVDAPKREWIDRFAAGSPGMATIAVEESLADAWSSLHPSIEGMEHGRFDPALAERFAEFVDEYAKKAVKENEQASKEAANRAGARLLLSMLGAHVRTRLRAAAPRASANVGSSASMETSGVDADAERWIEVTDELRRTDEALRANINLKHVLAGLVIQWARLVAPAGAAR